MGKSIATVAVLAFALLFGSTSYTFQTAKNDWCSGDFAWNGMVRVHHANSGLGPDSYNGHMMAPGPYMPDVTDMGSRTARKDGMKLAFDCTGWETRGR